MKTLDSRAGRAALMVGHCAGMIDLVALPVWVGTLVSRYRLDAIQAGLLATVFLVGVVLASVTIAPRFRRLNVRVVAVAGFAVAGLCFGLASMTTGFPELAVLHGSSGLAAGAALSVTHGTVATSARPHRLFALLGAALGVFALAFLGLAPAVVAAKGGQALFLIFSGVMGAGAVAAAVAFPRPDDERQAVAPVSAPAPIPVAVWFGVAGIACMTLVQAMTFSFLERVGADRGFGAAGVAGVLIALGLVNLVPAGAAGVLENRLSARTVMLCGPVVQASLAAVIMNSPTFGPYAVAASLFAAVMIFTHTFAFGLLARIDRSGRALAATPAMVMTGSAIGPILGGTLVKVYGYGSLGLAALAIAAIAVAAFSRLPRSLPAGAPSAAIA